MGNLFGLIDQTGRGRWMLDSAFIGGGGNASNIDECRIMCANFMQQASYVEAEFHLARIALLRDPVRVDRFVAYLRRLREFNDFFSDFDRITR